ncbi:MAG: metallophosphatase family protein [Oscillospiraceae bacterium]|nr:metallophosphatase family protein [Oscillospiraceae bacterium]
MKYAIISDIHGNVSALQAVLNDIQLQSVDRFLLLGDFVVGLPWGNEVTELIRQLPSVTAVKGNGEEYLQQLKGSTQQDHIYEQFKPIYWAFNSLSDDNVYYLVSLPSEAVVIDSCHTIKLTHTNHIFNQEPSIDLLDSQTLNQRMKYDRLTHTEHLELIRDIVKTDATIQSEILQLEPAIYLFGHYHLQYSVEYRGRLFINPGSCGRALDWDNAANYTLLDIDYDTITITERRVEYDVKQTVMQLKASEFSRFAPVWSELMEQEIISGKDYTNTFVKQLATIAQEYGPVHFPLNNEIWQLAVERWDPANAF